MIIRSLYYQAENLHFLRQLHCQFILAPVSLLLLGVEDDLLHWSRYSLQLPVVVRVLRVVNTTRLEVRCSDE